KGRAQKGARWVPPGSGATSSIIPVWYSIPRQYMRTSSRGGSAYRTPVTGRYAITRSGATRTSTRSGAGTCSGTSWNAAGPGSETFFLSILASHAREETGGRVPTGSGKNGFFERSFQRKNTRVSTPHLTV